MVPRFNLCDETKVNLDRVSLQDSPILVILVEIFDGSVRNEEGGREGEREIERQRNGERETEDAISENFDANSRGIPASLYWDPFATNVTLRVPIEPGNRLNWSITRVVSHCSSIFKGLCIGSALSKLLLFKYKT